MRDPENSYLSSFDSPATRHITNFLYTISNDRVPIRPNLITSLFVLEKLLSNSYFRPITHLHTTAVPTHPHIAIHLLRKPNAQVHQNDGWKTSCKLKCPLLYGPYLVLGDCLSSASAPCSLPPPIPVKFPFSGFEWLLIEHVTGI